MTIAQKPKNRLIGNLEMLLIGDMSNKTGEPYIWFGTECRYLAHIDIGEQLDDYISWLKRFQKWSKPKCHPKK